MTQIPDAQYYQPVFSPWLGFGDYPAFFNSAQGVSLVDPLRCWILYCLLRQALRSEGEIWECGVYKGGTAAMMAHLLGERAPYKRLRLFDTFQGMPETHANFDVHQKGDFSDTSLETVKRVVGHPDIAIFHQGSIPDTFDGLQKSNIALAHVDVDIWQSVVDCCEFIFPRLAVGGFMIFDDYGFPSCPGARNAVDLFFRDREAVPLVLPTGQAVVFKSR